MVSLDAEIDLARGESFEGFIKKQNIRLIFSVTNIIIGIDLKFTANKEKKDDTDLLVQGSAHAGIMI